MAKVVEMDADQIRDIVLRSLYERHRKARGVKAQEIGIRDLQQEMKTRHGLSQQFVASNLDYLVQKEWVLAMRKDRSFTTSAGTVRSSEQVTYKISHLGIDRVEGDSEFKRSSPFGGVNINNVQGVVVLGDHNVVKNEFASLSQELRLLQRRVTESGLQDQDKVDAIAEIETVQSQLAKREPNASIIQQAWAAAQKLVTVGNLASHAAKAAQLISTLLAQGAVS